MRNLRISTQLILPEQNDALPPTNADVNQTEAMSGAVLDADLPSGGSKAKKL
jgi:hypothetical protein